MSGHSKWSKVKHQKAVTDVVKGAVFTKASRAITVAVTDGGGVTDPNNNFRLRLAIENARAVNMPNDTIARAMERGRGTGAASLESILYEGYGPGGVALLIETATDNRKRTVAILKKVLDRAQGTIAAPGAVQFLFKRCGIITVRKEKVTFDEIFSDAVVAGATDVSEKEDVYELFTEPVDIEAVAKKLADLGLPVDNTAIIQKPTNTISLSSEDARKIENLTSELESLEDVLRVYDNAAYP